MRIYCIYDKVAQEGGPLVLLKNDDVASRFFLNTLKGEMKNGCNPNDYELRCLGKYDSEKAVIYTSDLVISEDGTKQYNDINCIVPVKVGANEE